MTKRFLKNKLLLLIYFLNRHKAIIAAFSLFLFLLVILHSDIYKYSVEIQVDESSTNTSLTLFDSNNTVSLQRNVIKSKHPQTVLFITPNKKLLDINIKSDSDVGTISISRISINKHFDFHNFAISIPINRIVNEHLFEKFLVTINTETILDNRNGGGIEVSDIDRLLLSSAFNIDAMYTYGLFISAVIIMGIPISLFFLILYYTQIYTCILTLYQRTNRTHNDFFIPLLLITVISFITYWNFIIFNKVYIFYDIGSDTMTYFWPLFHHISEYIKSNGVPSWSFNLGLGQNLYPRFISDPFSLILFIFDSQYIPHLLVYSQILKIITAGLLFYFYIRALNLSKYTAIIGAILYAFNGHMIVRGGWYHYATDCVIFAFLLYAVELFIQKKSWKLLPLAFFSIYWKGNAQFFYVILFGGMIFLYALFRYIEIYKYRPKQLLLFFAQLFGLYILGIFLGSVFLFPETYTFLLSSRVGGGHSVIGDMISYPPYILNTIETIQLSLASLFSPNMFNGIEGIPLSPNLPASHNLLESPLFYSGIIPLLSVPYTIIYTTKKKRLVYFTILVLISIYFLFPYPRFLFNAFSGSYYKINSLWIIIILLYMGLSGLDIIRKNKNVSILPLTIISFLITITLLYLLFNTISLLNRQALYTALFFNTCYYFFFLRYFTKRSLVSAHHLSIILVAIVCIEVLWNSYIAVNNRVALTPQDIQESSSYSDATHKAVSLIGKNDPGFYRIDKNYLSYFLNDGLIQGYYGTKAYQSFNHPQYLTFLDKLQVEKDQKYDSLGNLGLPNYIFGLENRNNLNTLLGVKYYLVKTDDFINDDVPDGYYLYNNIDNIAIYKNSNYLPIGIFYDTYITERDLYKYSPEKWDTLLLNHLVLPSDVKHSKNLKQKLEPGHNDHEINYEQIVKQIRNNTLEVEDHKQKSINGTIQTEREGILFLSIPYDSGWKVRVNDKEETIYPIHFGMSGVHLTKGNNRVELEYEVPYFIVGLVATIISIGCYLLCLFSGKIRTFLNYHLTQKEK